MGPTVEFEAQEAIKRVVDPFRASLENYCLLVLVLLILFVVPYLYRVRVGEARSEKRESRGKEIADASNRGFGPECFLCTSLH